MPFLLLSFTDYLVLWVDLQARLAVSFKDFKNRKHVIHEIYVLAPGSLDVMIDGHTVYEYHNEPTEIRKWATRQCYTREEGELKLFKLIMQSVS